MKIIFHDGYKNSGYASDTAASEGRMESIMDLLGKQDDYSVCKPTPAHLDDILLAYQRR